MLFQRNHPEIFLVRSCLTITLVSYGCRHRPSDLMTRDDAWVGTLVTKYSKVSLGPSRNFPSYN